MLPDFLAPDLDMVFVGTSPGTLSAALGHYYSRPNNTFWELLWEAGLTGERRLIPEQDATILQYGIGLTDLVQSRASSSDNDLTSGDYDVPGFLQKIEAFESFVVAMNGKKAAEKVGRHLGVRGGGHRLAGWKIGECRVYILPSSSGANATPAYFLPKSSKAEWWIEFGKWLRSNRGARS